METVSPAAVAAGRTIDVAYGGFWRRAVALLIDWFIVGITLSSIFLLLAMAFPSIGTMITLNSPLGLFTVNRTLETVPGVTTAKDGVTTTVNEEIVERTVLDRWTYLFRTKETVETWTTPSGTQTKKTKVWQRIDPETKGEVETWDVTSITFIVLLLYWVAMESSRFQASLGKMALGLKVVDGRGERVTIWRAAVRNLLKVVSAATLFIGFMMAGWTARKQALHDKMADCLVVAP